jgi:hypothetical protein
VQQIGKILVIFRENPKIDEKRVVRHEARETAKAKKPSHASRLKPQASATHTSRPRSRTPSPRPESEPRRRRPKTSR